MLDNWRVLNDNWLLLEGWLFPSAALLPLFPSTFLLSGDLLNSDLLCLEAFDEVEMRGDKSDSHDVDNNSHKASKLSGMSVTSVTSVVSFLSMMTVVSLWEFLGLDHWWSWWHSVEGLLFIVLHWWWWWTSLVSSSMLSSSMVSATLLWSTLMVSSTTSSAVHVLNELAPEALWLFIFLLGFLLNLIKLDAWKWITKEDSWWQSSSILDRVARWFDGSGIAPRATLRFALACSTVFFTCLFSCFSEIIEGIWNSIESSSHSVEFIHGTVHHLLGLLDESLVLQEVKFRAFENGCWKMLGVFNRVAGISDCSGLAPRANIIGIAGISITKSIASIFVIFDNWLHFFLFLTNIGAMENSCWESHGVLNRVACVSDSSSCAPRALGIISIAGSAIFMCLAI